jgi:hypothetical protein
LFIDPFEGYLKKCFYIGRVHLFHPNHRPQNLVFLTEFSLYAMVFGVRSVAGSGDQGNIIAVRGCQNLLFSALDKFDVFVVVLQ